ncbi:MAG TPA: hypothetical protein VHO91_00585 [Rhodopila sp.]|nr:hypothetical protein [Rhodopila sp.]
MRRLLLCCTASIFLYVTAFAWVLDRPLSLGALRTRIEAGLRSGAAIRGPKLVILAGSNGPYSHRCAVIGKLVGVPCVNAGIAVGIGLDYLFTRWKPLLHRGDIVYLPLEEVQYSRPRATTELGPDASIMLRHDRRTLWTMPLRRQLAALFASDLRGAIMSVMETTLVAGGFQDPRAATTGSFNAWGDHIGHTAALAAGNLTALAAAKPFHPNATQIRTGYGSVLVADFIAWALAHDVTVVGGLPTGFADSPIPDASLEAIRAIYRNNHAIFLALPNHSRYPRSAFFDTPDHLNEAAQIRHSISIGQALARLRQRIMDRQLARCP